MKIVTDTPGQLVLKSFSWGVLLFAFVLFFFGVIGSLLLSLVLSVTVGILAGVVFLLAAIGILLMLRTATFTFDRHSGTLSIVKKGIFGTKQEQVNLRDFQSVRLEKSVFTHHDPGRPDTVSYHVELVRPDGTAYRVEASAANIAGGKPGKERLLEKIRPFVEGA